MVNYKDKQTNLGFSPPCVQEDDAMLDFTCCLLESVTFMPIFLVSEIILSTKGVPQNVDKITKIVRHDITKYAQFTMYFYIQTYVDIIPLINSKKSSNYLLL